MKKRHDEAEAKLIAEAEALLVKKEEEKREAQEEIRFEYTVLFKGGPKVSDPITNFLGLAKVWG